MTAIRELFIAKIAACVTFVRISWSILAKKNFLSRGGHRTDSRKRDAPDVRRRQLSQPLCRGRHVWLTATSAASVWGAPAQFLEAFLASFPAHQIQQQNADYRSDRCRQHINKKLTVMPCDECNQEEIVADRKKEKRRIQDAQDDES